MHFFPNLQIGSPQQHALCTFEIVAPKFRLCKKILNKDFAKLRKIWRRLHFTTLGPCSCFCWNASKLQNGKNEGNPDCWLVLEAKNAFFLLWLALPYFCLVRKWRRHTNKDDEITSPTLRQTCSFELFLKATVRNLDDQRIFLSERIFFPSSGEGLKKSSLDYFPKTLEPRQQKKVVPSAFQL